MKIKITMVSGKEHIFENIKYHNIDEWIKNFKGDGAWFKIYPECVFVIRIENIETIEEMEE